MRIRHKLFILSLVQILSVTLNPIIAEQTEDEIRFFVSPHGNDQGKGTEKSPFKTLEKARNVIRTMRNNGEEEKVTVCLRGGTYWLKQPFLLGTEDSNVVYKAFESEVPVLSGGQKIDTWKMLNRNMAGVSEVAKGKIWVADIPKGWLFHYLFVNGERAERSKSVHDSWRKWPKDHQFILSEKGDEQFVRFEDKEQLKYLSSKGDVELVCIMAQYGIMGNVVVTDVDPDAGTVKWNSKQVYFRESRDPYERGYCFENALCFIDRPGEWAVDSEKGKVYYWPRPEEDMKTAQVIAPRLCELVRLQGDEKKQEYVRNVSMEGLTFIYTDRVPENKWPDEWLTRQWENVGASIYLTGTEKCRLYDCRILHSGSYGITINHYGQHNIIEKCEIGWTGSGGVFLEGYGPGTLDVNKYNRLVRNYIHDHGLGNYWHSPSVQIYQSGENEITYNLLQRSAYNGISMVGVHPDHLTQKKFFFPGTYEGLYHFWNQYKVRWADFPKEIQKGIRENTFKFDRTNTKDYLHARHNLVEYNIISEPHSKLNEGGAIYAFCLGVGNRWLNNVAFKSSAMPGSSIFALDDIAEYTTVKDNVYWINGVILDGVGARPNERGNDISGNIRVNFKREFEQKRSHDKKGKWYMDVEGREALDYLVNRITDKVKLLGGWPKNASVCIPGPSDEITQFGEELILPPGAHVTIE